MQLSGNRKKTRSSAIFLTLQISLSILNQGLGSNQPQFFWGKLQSFFFSGEGSKSVKSTYECIQAIPTSQSTYKYENGCTTENDVQDIAVNLDSTNDARVLLSNDFVRFQLQECLQECVAGSFMCLENDDDLTSTHITEDLFEKGDGTADHTPCCKPVRVDLVNTDIAEANNNEEYAFIFSQ